MSIAAALIQTLAISTLATMVVLSATATDRRLRAIEERVRALETLARARLP